ncbi:MAG: tRNA (adenosine(37)-N6)-threonylcarbamoyltransferase complex ATPase subunit type 1 TsaE [Thiobacillus sp.]|uniref:tRNA (adenosine(37)-N6)-threonylcarbamoyltransferase complex ATPase subunit type 1 TsaE n=1 Tax=Thiobacillus sp. TaxID=924 RepID=UPI0028954D54|nr:tRNA (adenosine(37)-N6)-threonylcarbamoyltransferase complex ATPase subunit type 1 TsaE [Thiobacillus sp.]MDT3708503.1 tRNA (adenosine(37)-N6)-threonylcarbamoyltransferase complex ATPase subunit type 1 TsaE [Thiobacillus sp.]
MHENNDTPRCRRHLPDETATLAFGVQLARGLTPGLTFYLEGDLGAGKTTLVRGLLRGLGYTGRVKSPTYTLVETYGLPGFELYHFDLYRMHDPREWLDAGFREVSDGRAVSLIEWPEKAVGWLPQPDVIIRLAIADDAREIECQATSARGAHYLEACCTPC